MFSVYLIVTHKLYSGFIVSEKHNKKQVLCPIVVQCKNGSFQQGKAPCGSFLSNLHDKKKVFKERAVVRSKIYLAAVRTATGVKLLYYLLD